MYQANIFDNILSFFGKYDGLLFWEGGLAKSSFRLCQEGVHVLFDDFVEKESGDHGMDVVPKLKGHGEV